MINSKKKKSETKRNILKRLEAVGVTNRREERQGRTDDELK